MPPIKLSWPPASGDAHLLLVMGLAHAGRCRDCGARMDELVINADATCNIGHSARRAAARRPHFRRWLCRRAHERARGRTMLARRRLFIAALFFGIASTAACRRERRRPHRLGLQMPPRYKWGRRDVTFRCRYAGILLPHGNIPA